MTAVIYSMIIQGFLKMNLLKLIFMLLIGVGFTAWVCGNDIVLIDRTNGAAGVRDFLGRAFSRKAGNIAFPKDLAISIVSPDEVKSTAEASSIIWIEEEFSPAFDHGKKQFVAEPFALLPVVILVSADCPVDSLTVKELKLIYSGRADNWHQFKGGALPIRLAGASPDSAEGRVFRKLVMQQDIFSSKTPAPGCDILPDMLVCNTPEAAGNLIKALPGMIVFGSWKMVNMKSDSCKVLKVNNIEPTMENIAARRYPLTVCHLMRYEKTVSQKKIQKMVDFLKKSALSGGKSVILK